jgi:hypothetical protein
LQVAAERGPRDLVLIPSISELPCDGEQPEFWGAGIDLWAISAGADRSIFAVF